MKVICVSNGELPRERLSLTIGKIYFVLSDKPNSDSVSHVYIIDNSGNRNWYKRNLFIDATPYIREQKLKQLGI